MNTESNTEVNKQPLTVGEVLERDHHRIDGFFADFEASLGTGTIDTEALAEGSGGLRHHIWVEEKFHFPAMRAAGLFGPVMVMLREHGQLWDLLDRMEDQARAAVDVDELTTTWQAFSETLEAHNEKEEKILYPAGDEILDVSLGEEILEKMKSPDIPTGWTCEMSGRS